MIKGQKIMVKSSNRNGNIILRPAELSQYQPDGIDAFQVTFLDIKFRKGGRDLTSCTVLASKIVEI